MAKGEIPQYDNGLIKFYELGSYFPPDPVRAPFGVFEDTTWKNHHAYFLYREWNRPHIAPEDRSEADNLRIQFRNSRYNRLMLLMRDEDRLHLDIPYVDPSSLDLDVAAASLRDFKLLTDLGAASLGYNMTQDPNLRYSDGYPLGVHPRLSDTTTAERLDFYQQKREETLAKLDGVEVTPEDVITSVLFRYAHHLQDPVLREVAHARADRGTVVYPLDLIGHHALRDMAYGLLSREFDRELKQAA